MVTKIDDSKFGYAALPHLLLHSNKNTFETKEKIEVYIKRHKRQYVAVDIIH